MKNSYIIDDFKMFIRIRSETGTWHSEHSSVCHETSRENVNIILSDRNYFCIFCTVIQRLFITLYKGAENKTWIIYIENINDFFHSLL